MRLTLRTLPLSTNNLYAHRGARRFLTSRGRDNKEAMAWEIRSQYRGKPLEGAVRADIALWWPDRRRHDIDNIKALLDACTGLLWADDSQITDLHLRKGIDREAPRVEITAEAVTS